MRELSSVEVAQANGAGCGPEMVDELIGVATIVFGASLVAALSVGALIGYYLSSGLQAQSSGIEVK